VGTALKNDHPISNIIDGLITQSVGDDLMVSKTDDLDGAGP
jgi:hypothetical protein